MLRNVAVVLVNGFMPFEFGTVCQVFGVDRSDDGLPRYDFAVVAGEPAPLHALGFTIDPALGLERLAEADLIALPAVSDERLSLPGRLAAPPPPDSARRFPEDLLEALRTAVERGARVLGVCSGAFILGDAGLLDDRRCTTHWRNAAELARRYPRAKVDPDVLYVDDDPVITSAGTAAGIDACLYLVRKEQGSRVANGIARRMVVPPHRDGGQAQYVGQPVAPACTAPCKTCWSGCAPTCTSRSPSVSWLRARRCRSGPSPAASWPTPAPPRSGGSTASAFCWPSSRWRRPSRRDAIADRTGFGNATALRHHFRLWRGTTPNAYRRLFRGDPSPSAPAAQ